MKTNVIEKGKWERDLEVEVPRERIDREMSAALKRYQKRLEMPGFRRGKVPLKVIEKRYGPSIRYGLIEDLLPTLMREAAQQTGLVPAGTPRITSLDEDPAGGLKFTASVDIWPEVEVQGHEGLKVTRLTHAVTDAEIDEQLQELRARHAAERSIERGLAKGDVLIADLQRLDDGGVPIIGERYEERYFLIGADGAPSPGFEEALIGICAGEERRVRFAYRDDLPNPDLAGKKEHFAVSAREVRERVLPQLDDEFAKDVGDQFGSLGDLKEHIRRQLDERWQFVSRQKLRSDAIDGLLRANPVEIPDSLVVSYLESLRRERDEHEHRHDHRRQGDHGHEHHGHGHEHEHDDDGDAGREAPGAEEREAATRRLQTYIVMEGLRRKVGVEVSDAEFEAYLEDRSRRLGLKLEELKRSPRAADLRRELEEEKVFAYLEQHAVVDDKPV